MKRRLIALVVYYALVLGFILLVAAINGQGTY